MGVITHMKKIKKNFCLIICLSAFTVFALGSGDSNSSTGFTNNYGTSTTICAHPGCSNYIAKSGDTNCCTIHSNHCANCGKYIDEDATYCMDCIYETIMN